MPIWQKTLPQYSHAAVGNVLEKYQYLDKQDRAFISRMAEGTLECQIQLDYVIDQFSSMPVRKMKPVIRFCIRQLLLAQDACIAQNAHGTAGCIKFNRLVVAKCLTKATQGR